MSTNDKTNGYNCLKVSKFDHSSTTPRATRWREWVVKLRYAFGSAFPLLANQTSEVLDPLNYWWGLTWSPLLDLDNMNQEQEQKLYVDFQKAQYSLLHVLSENFGTHEKQIIADHDPVQLVEKLKTKYLVEWNAKLEFFPDKPGWTPTHWMTTWLPFGYMCLHNIAAKYIDTGVTDAITKHDAYVASKTFTPSHITKWVSTVEHAWAGWRNTVTDPEHMAAVELVREILSSDHEDWKTWAFSFATQQGDKPYTVADLLEKVVNQDKLLNAGGTKKKATALLAGHGISRPAFKTKNNKKGNQKKRCATKDCKNFVRVHFHKFCDECYSSRKEKSSAENESSALDDVPATVREQNHNRKLTVLKKKMAQMSSVRNKQKREALLHEANALLASCGDAVNKKNKKNKIDEEEHEAGLAELPVDTHATSEMPIPSPKSKPKKKKTAQDDELDRTLAHCTVQRFAGCSVPSNYAL
jgi:hypothetical protein